LSYFLARHQIGSLFELIGIGENSEEFATANGGAINQTYHKFIAKYQCHSMWLWKLVRIISCNAINCSNFYIFWNYLQDMRPFD
jgi:hypothetical protein